MPVLRVLAPGIRIIKTPVFSISKDVNYIHLTCYRCLVKDHSYSPGISPHGLVLCHACQPFVQQKINQTSREITTKLSHLNNSEKEKGTYIIRSISQNEESPEDRTCSDFVQEFYEEKKLNEEDLVSKENHVSKVTRIPPDPPTDCCMSGCANCVWIRYAEEMKEFYSSDGIEKALKDIETIEDVSLKAFLKVELSFLKK